MQSGRSLCPLQISKTSRNFCSLSQATMGHVQETQLELPRTSHTPMSCLQLPLEKNASPFIASCKSLADVSLWMILVQDPAEKELLGESCSFWLCIASQRQSLRMHGSNVTWTREPAHKGHSVKPWLCLQKVSAERHTCHLQGEAPKTGRATRAVQALEVKLTG